VWTRPHFLPSRMSIHRIVATRIRRSRVCVPPLDLPDFT
jgi:hypothetical protein